MLSLFDGLGKIRSDFADAELASLNDAEVEALTAIIKADRAVVLAETDGRDNDAHVAALAKTLSDAEAEYQANLPKTDRVDEVRRVAETQRRLALGLKPLPPVKGVENPKLVSAVKKADQALNAARVNGYRIRDDIRAKRAVLSAAIMAWQRLNVFTPDDLVREHLAKVQADNARIAAEGGTVAEKVVEPVLSHLDAVLQSGKKKAGHNSINFGFGRKFAR